MVFTKEVIKDKNREILHCISTKDRMSHDYHFCPFLKIIHSSVFTCMICRGGKSITTYAMMLKYEPEKALKKKRQQMTLPHWSCGFYIICSPENNFQKSHKQVH